MSWGAETAVCRLPILLSVVERPELHLLALAAAAAAATAADMFGISVELTNLGSSVFCRFNI